MDDKITTLKNMIAKADRIVIGAGAGLSASAGLLYGGKRFTDNFMHYQEKYGFDNMYSGAFYPYETLEEYWAYFAQHIKLNRYTPLETKTYDNLLSLVKDKNYFVITTNVDHKFIESGFDKNRLFYTQGDYGLFQCSVPCKNYTIDNKEIVEKMLNSIDGFKIDKSLVPRCVYCNSPMSMNLRADGTFVEDEFWHIASERYSSFVSSIGKERVLYFELGVGMNTPSIIKFPFWQWTYQNKNAQFATISLDSDYVPNEIESQSVAIVADIDLVLCKLVNN